MLSLVTSNPAKYQPFSSTLERLRIGLEKPRQAPLERQTLSFTQALEDKARGMAALYDRPVLVDDAGLVLEAYPGFPGPLTSVVLRGIGIPGLKRLLEGLSHRAKFECHIGCWVHGQLRVFSGAVDGHIDFSRPIASDKLPLTELFVPDESALPGQLLHRAKALAALESNAFELHLETAPANELDTVNCTRDSVSQCPFCAELDGNDQTIFSEMIQGRLGSRIIYEDDNFVVMPPLGQFIEGGLLLLARRHILSFAHLPAPLFEPLERLLGAISEALSQRWGTAPLIFEHGPAPERTKGVCCVDHAHFNIFPAKVHLAPHLRQRMSFPLSSLSGLSKARSAEYGYLFIQENDGTRALYDGKDVPTQLVRRIITSEIGFADRWHWRDYPGYDELLRTYETLKGQIRL
jgi:XTP/dITP diphosphohydrolase